MSRRSCERCSADPASAAHTATNRITAKNAGRSRLARRSQNPAERDPTVAVVFLEQQRRDQEPRHDEEHFDAEEATVHPREPAVVEEHDDHRKGPQPVERRLISHALRVVRWWRHDTGRPADETTWTPSANALMSPGFGPAAFGSGTDDPDGAMVSVTGESSYRLWSSRRSIRRPAVRLGSRRHVRSLGRLGPRRARPPRRARRPAPRAATPSSRPTAVADLVDRGGERCSR